MGSNNEGKRSREVRINQATVDRCTGYVNANAKILYLNWY